jgi:hypothetical protein
MATAVAAEVMATAVAAEVMATMATMATLMKKTTNSSSIFF